jgi:ABC-2 type transport system ATP-binding protein
MVLGLERPDAGTATFDGVAYVDLPSPVRTVGAVLETAFHPARSGRNHLRVYCRAAGLPVTRADEVLAQVGLADAGRRRAGGYSLGMRQRLGLAAALLGDPRVLVLDEPANGLDPDGIRWLRGLLRHLANEGRTVLVSSHQLGEVQAIADRIVILNRGQLVRSGSIDELTAGTDSVFVRTPQVDTLRAALERHGEVQQPDSGTLQVRGLTCEQVGHIAFESGVELHELSPRKFDLEELFFALTQSAEPQVPPGAPPGTPPGPPPGPIYGPPQGPPPGWGPQ